MSVGFVINNALRGGNDPFQLTFMYMARIFTTGVSVSILVVFLLYEFKVWCTKR